MEASGAPAKRIKAGRRHQRDLLDLRPELRCPARQRVLVFVIFGLASGLLENAGGLVLVLLAGIVRLAGHALFTGFVVKLVADVRDGRRDQTVGDLFSSAAPAILPLIAFGILFGIGVAIGLVLLIVPGLILLTFWSVGAPAIVVEDAGPIEAFGRSWRLVRGRCLVGVRRPSWSALLIVIAVGIVLGVIATPIGNGAILVASIISTTITAPIFSLAVSVMFFDLGGGRTAEPLGAPTEPPAPAAPTA